jgi:hypothetical protein
MELFAVIQDSKNDSPIYIPQASMQWGSGIPALI